MRGFGKSLVFLFCLTRLSFCARAETELGFADAARLAVEASDELRNEYASKALREGAWHWGVRAYLPKFSISASEEDRLSEINADSFLKNYSVNVDQLLWDGGRLSLARKTEKAELDLLGNRLKQNASDIAEGAVSAYRDVLQARKIIAIQKKSLESLDEQRMILKRELELGLVHQAVLAEAEITVALAELEIASLSFDLEEMEWKLAEKLGLEKLPPLSEQINTQRELRIIDAVTARDLAESRNLELAAFRFSLAKRQAELRAASLGWVPSFRLNGSFSLSGRQYPLSRYSWSVGFSMDFSSPWLSGNLGFSSGREPPYDKNARLQQTLVPAPEPAAAFSARSAGLYLANERAKYRSALTEITAAAERGVKTCVLLDKKRLLATEALKLEGEKYRLAEIKLSLGEITRIDLMEAMVDYTKREAALVEAAVMVLQAERALERILDLGPGGLSMLAEEDA